MRHRTALITAASIAGVTVTGAIAIGASLGILDASAETEVGSLSASVEPDPTVIDVYLEDQASTAAPAVAVSSPTPLSSLSAATNGEPTTYAVEEAGTVTVEQGSDDVVSVVSVQLQQGWSWSESRRDDGALVVTLTDQVTTYELVAVGGPEGIDATVDQPIVQIVTIPGPNTSSPGNSADPTAEPTPDPTVVPTVQDDDEGDDEDEAEDQEDEDEQEDQDDDEEDEGDDWDD